HGQRLVDDAGAPRVLDAEVDGVPFSLGNAHLADQIDATDQAAQVDRVPGTIEAAVRVQEPTDARLAAALVLVEAEVPDLDAVVPVGVEHRQIVAGLRGHDHPARPHIVPLDRI